MKMPKKISKEELKGLPPELIKQLSVKPKSEEQYKLIAEIIGESGGTADINTILIAIYKKTNVVCKRNTLVSNLYRMAGKGMIRQVPGRLGIYSLITPK